MTISDPIPARLAALKTSPMPYLKQQWRDLFDGEPPPFNRRYLESRLAYRIQELAYGGLKPETIRVMDMVRANNNTTSTWADRPTDGDATWHDAGAPWEHLVDLANTTAQVQA